MSESENILSLLFGCIFAISTQLKLMEEYSDAFLNLPQQSFIPYTLMKVGLLQPQKSGYLSQPQVDLPRWRHLLYQQRY